MKRLSAFRWSVPVFLLLSLACSALPRLTRVPPGAPAAAPGTPTAQAAIDQPAAPSTTLRMPTQPAAKEQPANPSTTLRMPAQPAAVDQPEPTTPPTPEPPDAMLEPRRTQAPSSRVINLPLVMAERGIPLYIGSEAPAGMRDQIQLPPGWILTGDRETAQLILTAGGEPVLSRWIYALVAPFPTLVKGVSSADLRRAWSGTPAGPFAGRPLLLDPAALAAFSVAWGPPAEGAVQVHPAEALSAAAWDSQPAWALVPFEALEPRWKVLEVDGASPMRRSFDASAWPLSVSFSLQGTLPDGSPDGDPAARLIPATNRDPSRLTVAALTGVTALVRATAFTMEQQGIEYPARDVGELLRAADLTHISNEVPFASNCPFPDPVQEGLVFCSDPRYIGLLDAVGADIIELTGDHFRDWGDAAMFETLQLYQERGWQYYGGGANLEEGRRPLLVEHNGNRLAWIGCNAKGLAAAGPNRPGAATCDMDWMAAEVSRLRAEGYLPVATFQHYEYYTYAAQPNQERDARILAEAGAVIVSGSQAHQPQAFEFDEGALIHHGLGNLFFDQYEVSEATRQAFIDFHVFYDNRYLGVELLPIVFVDYARPRLMTPEESDALLQAVFSASGW